MKRVYATYFGLGLLLAPTPLLNVLQAESAAVVAFVAFFVAGLSALGAFERDSGSVGPVLVRQEAALLLPLGILTLAQLWAPNCTFLQGLLFFGLFPVVTVVFAVSVAYALTGTNLARPGLVLVVLGILIALGGPLYDLGLHPQFYTYNHVFGGVLGPIYDEQLAVRPGLFAFRGLTLLWAGAAFVLGHRLRGRGRPWTLSIFALAIGGVYLFSAPLGVNSPAWYLQEQLGGHVQTEHFDLYYDRAQLNAARANELASAHEAEYSWIRDRLGTDVTEEGRPIQSYIYPNPEVKGRLTGARSTSVTPVWLDVPQVHLLKNRVSSSLGHELAHVASRPYGLPGLRASWAPGLVEGWAVALEPPSLGPSPDDLVLTAATSNSTGALLAEAEAIADRLSPWGFWTGRGAVSYATMGSFVEYLLNRFGPKKLREVYAWGNFRSVYGQGLPSLAQDWARHLQRRTSVHRDAHDVVTRRFTRPSLFETRCPHYVPPARMHLQAAKQAGRRRDTSQMVRQLDRALDAEPQFAEAHEQLARVRLAQPNPQAVLRQLDTLSSKVHTVGIRLARADARALTGAADSARALYGEALDSLPNYASDTRGRILLREVVADRPAVVGVLVSADSAHVQAQQLAEFSPAGPAVRAWQAVRLMDAGRYGRAHRVWRSLGTFVPRRWARGRQREWGLQKKMWRARSALLGDARDAAGQLALEGVRRARVHGDEARAAVFDWWVDRAQGRTVESSHRLHPPAVLDSNSAPASNHAVRLLVGSHSRISSSTRRSDFLPVGSSSGACE